MATNIRNLAPVRAKLFRHFVEPIVSNARINAKDRLVLLAQRPTVVLPVSTKGPLVLHKALKVPEELILQWCAVVVIFDGVDELSLAFKIWPSGHKYLTYLGRR